MGPHKKRRKQSESSSSDSSEDKSKKKHSEKKKKKLKRKHVSSSSSESSSSSTDSEEERRRLEKKKLKKAKKKSKSKKKPEESNDIPLELMEKSRAMAPMTKQEWDKQQSVIRRVYDETTGRHRLIKGDGEVIEEIVSRDRHKAINQQATTGDGNYFQTQTLKK